MTQDVEIRPAKLEDLPAINAIYNTYVKETPVTFDLDPTTVAERKIWYEQFSDKGPHQIIVAEKAGTVIGYAGSMQFRKKPAYAPSVEITIYVSPEHQARGLGIKLYETLLARLKGHGVHQLLAGITLPNRKSEVLHQKMGFSRVGIFHEVGYKFGQYWDVAWYERALEP